MKQFKVQLFSTSNYAAEQIILQAARVNAGQANTSLKGFELMGKGLTQQFPQLCPDPITFELIDNMLHIDCKGLNGWEQAAIIEEVTIFELSTTKEEKEEVI